MIGPHPTLSVSIGVLIEVFSFEQWGCTGVRRCFQWGCAGVKRGLWSFGSGSRQCNKEPHLTPAQPHGLTPSGLVDAVRWLIGLEEAEELVIVVNPSRRGRVEPRVVKRRPKQYMRMTMPRSSLRNQLPMKNF
jgi:hypothetical protein